MSIFGSIWSKISGHHAAGGQAQGSSQGSPQGSSQTSAQTSAQNSAPGSTPAQQEVVTSPTSVVNPESTAAPQVAAPAPNSTGGSGLSPAPSPSAQPAAAGLVDVAAVLTDLASKKREHLDWRHSIVDLLKVLDLDSSLASRKSLAEELGYSGDTGDSAAMNMWLHKQVMAKLAANGGQVPAELRD